MIYVYKCPECSHEVELNRKMDDRDDPVNCEICHNPMRRKFVWPMAQVWAGKFHDRWNQVNPTDGLEPTW